MALPVLHIWEPGRAVTGAEWRMFLVVAAAAAAAAPFGPGVRLAVKPGRVEVDGDGALWRLALTPRDREVSACVMEDSDDANAAARLLLALHSACAPGAMAIGSTAPAAAWRETAALASEILGRRVAPPAMVGQDVPDDFRDRFEAALAVSAHRERQDRDARRTERRRLRRRRTAPQRPDA